MYEYRNDYHQTRAKSKYSPEELDFGYKRASTSCSLSAPQKALMKAVKRLKEKLCGGENCHCWCPWGERE